MPERRGRKSDSQTPAPPADRIVGSKKNPKGSASSEDSAKKIVLSPTVKNTLKRKLEIFKEKYPKSENVTFEDLKAVYRRGTGAYSSTHRPTITGGVPNSRSAWGIARVNKFLEKAAGEKVKKAYVQDDDLLKYENGGLVGFNEDFKKWHKKVNQKINVFISSIHDLNKPVASPDHNSVILHLFEKNDETIDAKVHLKELTDLADKHKITIYLQPIPSHKNLSESKKKKITKDYLKSYYEKFGFIEVSDGWMERKPHSKYEDGGLTHSLEMAMTNLKKNGIVLKNSGITVIAYNTGNQERKPSLYSKKVIYDAIPSKKVASKIIQEVDKGNYENFNQSKIDDYKKSNLIIVNQNEVVYDSSNSDIRYEDGGLIAPNGKVSNLTPEQYKLVRTPEFKSWFGDWENDTENASKVVDDNGEPLVVWQGGTTKWWEQSSFVFNPQYEGKNTGVKRRPFGGVYFTSNYDVAKSFTRDSKSAFILPFFLNFRNPIKIDGEGVEIEYILGQYGQTSEGEKVKYKYDKSYDNDLIIYDVYDDTTYGKLPKSDIYITSKIFDKIKLADGTNNTFDKNNPDVRYIDGGLIAPNGKKSNLTPKQYKLVRTPAFKAWFGDWENDPENASKVLDENGEPLVVYHGSRYGGINIFDIKKSKRVSSGLKEYGNFFTSNILVAELYRNEGRYTKEVDEERIKEISKLEKLLDTAKSNREYRQIEMEIDKWYSKVYEVFLNLRKVKEFDAKLGTNKEGYYNLEVDAGYKIARGNDAIEFLKEGKFGVEKVDGIIAYNVVELMQKTPDWQDYVGNSYLVFDSQNIKLADGTNTTFDASNPDIRYDDGGLTHSLEMAMTNLKKNGIVIKHDGITLIAYNTGNHERQPSLYRKAIMYDAIHPKKQAAEIIEKFDKGQYENFDENEIQEYKNSHLIIINQNEVIYDSNNPNMMYEDGGETEKQIALPDTYATPSSLKRVLNNQGYDLIDKNLESNENKIEIMDFKNDLTVSDIDKKYHKYSHEFINKQLINGIKVEMEHTDKPEIARKIALDHLNENILYYEYLEEMEQKMENQKKIDDHFEEIFKDGGKIDPIFSLKTTTGEPTRLNYIQQILIRTSKFKQFFGDWETAAKSFIADGRNNFDRHFDGVSKIVDSVTLEPRVVYHGTMSEKEFFQFDVTREKGVGRPYAYFAFNKEYSENFTLSSQRGDDDAKPVMYQVFLNVRHPFYALGKEFENKEENAEHWIELITDRIYFDKYKRTQRDEFHQALKSTIYGQVGSYVNKVFPADIKQKFWRLMSFDANKEFKYFLIAYGYDGVIYDEEISSMYNVKNPAQYTKAVTIFDARQVKLADGRNTNFDALSSYIHYDHGGKINKPSPEHIKENHTPMNKKQQLEKMMFGGVFADGGKVKGDGKMHHDAKDGGYFVGHSHADGGIKAINKDTGQIIEVEGNEVIINKRSVADTTKREFEGEMLTNREILSRINEAGGGVSFEDGGQLSCCGKKYKFGGETKEDYVIIYEISQSKDDNTMAKEYLEAVYK